MTATAERLALDLNAANDRIAEAIDALLAIRNLIAERPELAAAIEIGKHDSTRLHAFVGNSEYALPEKRIADVPGRIADLAEAAGRHGATLTAETGPTYGGVYATFGPFSLHLYAPLAQVATATAREVMDWELDPRLTAAAEQGSAR